MAKPPLFSVILPLYDPRGQVFTALQAWLDQRRTNDCFQIVLIDNGHRRLANELRGLLGPQDRLLGCQTINEAKLYNLGAQAAAGKWLLFTEAHVIPAPDFVSKLCPQLDGNSFDAASLGSAHLVRSRFSELEAQLFEQEQPAVRALGLWRCASMRGLVVRGSLFKLLGGLREQYFRFCETVLAMDIVEQGYRLAELPDVITIHAETDNAYELARSMYLGRIGSCRFWQEQPARAQRYFGGSSSDHCGHWTSPRCTARALRGLRRLTRHGQQGLARKLLSPLLPHLPLAFLGWRYHSAKVSIAAFVKTVKLYAQLMLYDPRKEGAGKERLLQSYRDVREQFARLGAVRFAADRDRAPIPNLTSYRWDCDTGTLTDSTVGFYPAEVWTDRRTYQWSQPEAGCALPLPAGMYRLQMDISPTGQWAVRRPKLFVDGLPIQAEAIHESNGLLSFTMHCKRNPLLSWTCDAFEPKTSGLPDERRLGVAIISIEAFALHESLSEEPKPSHVPRCLSNASEGGSCLPPGPGLGLAHRPPDDKHPQHTEELVGSHAS